MYYTLGQRQGLGIGGRADGREDRTVVRRRQGPRARNVLDGGPGPRPPAVVVTAGCVTESGRSWIRREPPSLARGRRGLWPAARQDSRIAGSADACRVRLGICNGAGVRAELRDSRNGPSTPGQYAVFYRRRRVPRRRNAIRGGLSQPAIRNEARRLGLIP